MKILLLIPLFLAGFFCCFAQHKGAVALTEAKFSTGDEAAWSSPNFDDNNWKTIKTGTVWQEQGFADYHGYAWYRIHVFIPSSLKENAFWKDSVRVYLAHVNDVDETWINGIKVGKTGAFPTDENGYISKWPAVRTYHVPANDKTIKWDAENIIAIRVYDGGGTGGIFMGAPYLDMLEKTDGLVVDASPANISYEKKNANLPLVIKNRFNTSIQGLLTVKITDEEVQKNLEQKTFDVSFKPLEEKTFRFSVPNKPGIKFSFAFTQKNTSVSFEESNSVPYILTPTPGLQPHINSPAIVGTHLGAPFIFKIAATGQKPLQYKASGLPGGLQLNAETGIISGALKDSGDHKIAITVVNQFGSATQSLIIKAGGLLALTPPMGWNSWNCWGVNVSEEKVKQAGQAFVDNGLIDYGWSYINIDDGWEAPGRASDSSILVNEKFSDMPSLGDWLHKRGLKFGIYSSPGPNTCGGFLGSYHNEEKDAATYASWGIDYLKYDWCSYDGVVGSDTSLASYVKPFALMDAALQKQNRDIVYNLCQYGMKDVWKWGANVNAQSWRTTEDIEDTWQSMSAIGFSQYPLHSYAGPGHWNDPDMMLVGQVGWGENLHPSRLTPDEQYTHVSLWCLLSAPLLIGCDLTKLDPFTLNLLTNREVIAIDQDILGKQAQLITKTDSSQIWMKALADGGKAIGLFNMSTNWQTLRLNGKELGFKSNATLHDVWRQKDIGKLNSGYTSRIPPHGVMLITIK